ncbi:MAG: NYN domain-containing protein [Bacteroidales bacterium]
MTEEKLQKLTRIGVFYDGNYFLHVSNYYNYVHSRQKRLSIAGLHAFIRQQVATKESAKMELCRITDAHYFRGRISAQDAAQRGNQLYYERVFDDILMSEGLVTHYFPIKSFHGKREEKNVDVYLALEAYDMAVCGKIDVLVLIASDGDFVPLIRKVNAMGIRVMLLCWDFDFTNDEGQKVITRTSQGLLKEVTYPVKMHDLIESQSASTDPMLINLFVQDESNSANKSVSQEEDVHIGDVLSLKNGYGFISYPNNNLFFHYTDVVNMDFNDLLVGDTVEFTIEKKYNGQDVAKTVTKIR